MPADQEWEDNSNAERMVWLEGVCEAPKLASRQDFYDLPDRARVKLEQSFVGPGVFKQVNCSELKTGKEIEREHAPTIAALKENPAMPNDDVYELISFNHESEFSGYYKALVNMEKELQAEKDRVCKMIQKNPDNVKALVGKPEFEKIKSHCDFYTKG